MEGAILKSFTYNGMGGNGAGVVILNEQIESKEKQRIASKIGLSETAFVKQIDELNYDISFYTPVCEVDLCGHATIAAFFYLGELGFIKGKTESKKVYQNTKAGKLEIEIIFNEGHVDYVLMQQAKPVIYGELNEFTINEISKSLNITRDSIGLKDYHIRPTVVSTGIKDIIIPVKNREILNNICPDNLLIKQISQNNDVCGYHVFTIDKNKIFARNFAPLVGIDEECATGTSNGALGSLLYSKGIIKDNIKVYQGEKMKETSLIIVDLKVISGELNVYVGGKAKVIKEITD